MNDTDEWSIVENKRTIKNKQKKKRKKEFFKQRDQAIKDGKLNEFMNKVHKKKPYTPKMTNEYKWIIKKYPGTDYLNITLPMVFETCEHFGERIFCQCCQLYYLTMLKKLNIPFEKQREFDCPGCPCCLGDFFD